MNSERTSINKRRTARILTIACGLLFFIFSFTYLSVFQKEVVEALHYSLAQGKTVYAPWISAVLISIILLAFRWGINGFIRLRGALAALSYFPSCLLLGVLTDVGHGVYHGEGISFMWAWLLPMLLVFYAILAIILARTSRFWENQELNGGIVVNSNLVILLLMCLMTACIGNANVHFHHELQMEEALRKQNYIEARKVAENTMDPSRNLTALRAYAMSREGTMGEYLFRYPQLYGASGLLMGNSDDKALRLNADSLYVYLGARPIMGESALTFFQRLCEEETGNYTTMDYYLSALLLERRVEKFVEAFDELYIVKDSIPYYYRQALFLDKKLHSSSNSDTVDVAMEGLWNKYMEKKQELSGQKGEGNRMRREFGNTYWWYYQYQ